MGKYITRDWYTMENVGNGIMVANFKAVEMTLESAKIYYDDLTEMADDFEGEFVIISDGTKSKWLKAEVRTAIGNYLKKYEKEQWGRYKQSIIVVPNVIVRTMLAGINLVSKPKVPQAVFTNMDDAMKAAQNAMMVAV